MGSPKLLFHVNEWSYLMLHNFLNPLKQATVGLREFQAQYEQQPAYIHSLALPGNLQAQHK